jgi:tetratricopeptide (TPR) repeat protein
MRIEDVRTPIAGLRIAGLRIAGLILCLLVLPAAAAAQEWRGQGRIAGKVTDADGKALPGVIVTATMPASENRGPEPQTTNNKGDWSIGGLAGGTWALDFAKDGYIAKTMTVPVSELGRMPPMTIALDEKPVVVDPNEVIRTRLTEAGALMTAGRFADARAIYEDLSRQYPTVKQFKPLLARAHHAEGNTERAIELLREAVAEDPTAIEVVVLLGTLLIDNGQLDAGKDVLAKVDASKVTDPTVFVNIAIGLINDKKQADAITWLDKGIATFPKDPNAYYYRGISHLGLGDVARAKADLEKFVELAPPDAPELPAAKKILAGIGGTGLSETHSRREGT